MNDFEVWKSYIDALDILTNQYSEPFDIKILEAKKDSSVVYRYIDSNQRDKIFKGLLKVFPNLNKENVNYQDNHLLYPLVEEINNSEIEDLKSFADSNHFEFSSKPAFSGTFKYPKTPLIDFLREHVVTEEAGQQEKSLTHHIKKKYPNSTYKEKNKGKIVVLDETYLEGVTIKEWGTTYSFEYRLSVKGISTPIDISISSDNVLAITHSKRKNKLSIKLHERISKAEIGEIRHKIAKILTEKIGRVPQISLNTVFTRTNFTRRHREQNTTVNQNLGKTQFLTLDELKHIDSKLETNQEVYREEVLGAIYKIDASESFINKQFDIAVRYLKENVGLLPYKVEGFLKQIHLKNVFLKKEAFEAFQENTFYSNSFHLVSYTITPDEFDKFEQIRKQRKIYYKSEYRPNLEGVILPNPDNNVFIQTFSASISLSDLQFEIFFFLNTLKRYFGKEHIQIVHEHIFRIDKQRFFEHIKEVIPYEEFQISSDAKTISFDFKTKEELSEKLQKLDTYDSLNYLGFGDDHKYKVTFGNITPLFLVKEKLDKLNFTKTILNESGNQLKVYGLMSDISLLPIVRANIENAAGNFTQDNIQLNWDDFDRGFVKYYFQFDEESYKEEVQKKLENLRGESLTHVDSKKTLGVLKSISYPNLTLLVEDKSLLEEGDYLTVKSALKGEKDKVKRLRDAVEKIYSDSGNSICNKNLKQALIDSSSLESFIDGDITRTNEYQELYQKVNGDLLSPYINERQKDAIVKCLLSDDLFIVQGPPGTGKSTAIAELIWQHLANNDSDKRYRILVTSETNLAVDNALDKLRSKTHLLMKSIRFGSEEKLDNEGRRFSLEAINHWKNNEWDGSDSLILDDWVDLINSRCINQSNDSFIKLWKEHLSEKGKVLRENVYSSYIKNCNVIGATCSSIGKINSEGRFTRFFQDFSNVFYPNEFKKFKSSPSRSSASILKNKKIEFELVIQDEASKASPPELALPFTFAKKAVIIGDHRQLPPMIDTNEFIESLIYLKDKSKDDNQVIKINKLIRFIKQHRESFELSHFEKLFTNIDTNLKSTFDTQYRMHPAINETIKQFYKGDFEDGIDLECGLPLDSVDDPNLNNPMSRYHGITKKKDTHVMWFDVQTPEIKKGTSRINPGEVKAIEWIINTITSNENYSTFINHWKENEKDQKELGVITFYGAQAGLIKKNIPEGIDVRVSPVDRFQGMERNIVIVSLVRSNIIAENEHQVPDYETFDNDYGYALNDSLGFAESPNRLNVALSRAKRLLIVVGNSKHFSRKEIYKNVFETMKNHPQGEVWDFEKLMKRIEK
ncbi:AAA domain-containing protein [Weeksellaceae bacterium KMM 9724]|uniref:AAA domain-containing protein n=1 Tax=Profundicola chukchiensis TaxID=2961959 RepID=UPI00243F1643|nr:AAA domain-containing protein [Profundicola chukchiensis]MDG4950778.1 AAA domain-containing protein [Profundicola chukchiensis]